MPLLWFAQEAKAARAFSTRFFGIRLWCAELRKQSLFLGEARGRPEGGTMPVAERQDWPRWQIIPTPVNPMIRARDETRLACVTEPLLQR